MGAEPPEMGISLISSLKSTDDGWLMLISHYMALYSLFIVGITMNQYWSPLSSNQKKEMPHLTGIRTWWKIYQQMAGCFMGGDSFLSWIQMPWVGSIFVVLYLLWWSNWFWIETHCVSFLDGKSQESEACVWGSPSCQENSDPQRWLAKTCIHSPMCNLLNLGGIQNK